MLKNKTINSKIKQYAFNSAWMLIAQLLRIVSGVFVGIYVARYLGPEQYGIISYALAIVAILASISRLGMDAILVRELARFPALRRELMGTAFGLMFLASVTCTIFLSGIVITLETPENQIYILITAAGALLQSFLVIDYNFQSQVKAKYSSIAKSLALGFSAISKLILVWLNADLLYFVLFYTFDSIIVAILLVIMHVANKQPAFFLSFKPKHIKPLLTSAWPMVISALSVALYMRIDQIMIKAMLSPYELGLYSSSVKIFEGWLILPYIISVSLLPAIVKLKTSSPYQYVKYMTMLFSIMFWLSVIVATVVSVFSLPIISITFGPEYLKAAPILSIVIWSATFSALGSVTARYLTVENMEKKIALRTIVGLIINFTMNLILIPLYGTEGAAIATLLTMFIANYVINYFDKDLKQLVDICNGSITLKWLWYDKKSDSA